MSEDAFERIRKGFGTQGSGSTQGSDGLHSPKDIKLPAVSLSQRVWSPSVPVPEVKALSDDRRGRREGLL